MLTRHEDKAITAADTKLSPAQERALAYQFRNSGMTDAERHEVGKLVILDAERRVRDDPFRRQMDEAGELTKDETKALAEAEAAHDAAVARRVAARIAAVKAEQTARKDGPVGFAGPTRAHIAVQQAETDLRLAEVDADTAADKLIRVRGRIERRLEYARYLMMARDSGIVR